MNTQYTYSEYLTECKRRFWIELLTRHKGNVSAVARSAGVHRTSVYKTMKMCRVDRYDIGSFDIEVDTTYREYVQRCEKAYWEALLDQVNHNVTQASKIANVGRTDFYKLKQRIGFELKRSRNVYWMNRGNAAWQALGC